MERAYVLSFFTFSFSVACAGSVSVFVPGMMLMEGRCSTLVS